jgi:hypothetical protein
VFTREGELTKIASDSIREAQTSTSRLCSVVEEMMHSHEDLASRISKLEREGSVFSARSQAGDDVSSIRTSRSRKALYYIGTAARLLRFSFERDLEDSRVYKRSFSRHSQSSLASSAIDSTAMSVFSNLSLAQVSSLSFYALPIYSTDLSNSDSYTFGDSEAHPRFPPTGPNWKDKRAGDKQFKVLLPTKESSKSPRPQKQPEYNAIHHHVGYPIEWARQNLIQTPNFELVTDPRNNIKSSSDLLFHPVTI